MLSHYPFKGIGYFLHGVSKLTASGLKRFIILPLIVNILIFSLFLSISFHFIEIFFKNYLLLLPDWLHGFEWFVWVLFFSAGATMILTIFILIGNLMSAPFNVFLSRRVEKLFSHTPADFVVSRFRETIKKSIMREWRKIRYFLPRAIFLIVLFFIPGINVIASIVWLIFSCWIAAISYIDYPLENREMIFEELPRFLRHHCLKSLGFGLAVLIASFVPIINFIVIPASVIGGTLFWVDSEENSSLE